MATPERTTPQPKTITIYVNNRAVELHKREVTGAEIKQAAGVPLNFKLYDPHGNEVENRQTVKVHPNERFTAISGQDVS